MKNKANKKVLLRELKRHTARHAASVLCDDLSWRGRGTYHDQGKGYLPCPEGRGYLPWAGRGSTYPGCREGYLPWPEGREYLTRLGYPSPGVDRQMPVKAVPPPILRMWVVITKLIKQCSIIKALTRPNCVSANWDRSGSKVSKRHWLNYSESALKGNGNSLVPSRSQETTCHGTLDMLVVKLTISKHGMPL